jgi:hypothetical protein
MIGQVIRLRCQREPMRWAAYFRNQVIVDVETNVEDFVRGRGLTVDSGLGPAEPQLEACVASAVRPAARSATKSRSGRRGLDNPSSSIGIRGIHSAV